MSTFAVTVVLMLSFTYIYDVSKLTIVWMTDMIQIWKSYNSPKQVTIKIVTSNNNNRFPIKAFILECKETTLFNLFVHVLTSSFSFSSSRFFAACLYNFSNFFASRSENCATNTQRLLKCKFVSCTMTHFLQLEQFSRSRLFILY